MVTSWDERCGIAEYSRYFIDSLKRHNRRLCLEVLSSPGEGVWEEQEVGHRICWNQRPHTNLAALRDHVLSNDTAVVHFQFNFGFFDLNELAYTIDELQRAGKKIIITFHATADLREGGKLISLRHIADALRRANLLLVHSASDQWRLASFGIARNVKIIPHGNLVFPQEDRSLREQWGVTLNPIVGTFGFLLPHKGILELLEAVAMLRREFPKFRAVGAMCFAS